MVEAYLYKKLKGDIVQCQNCAHYCVVEPGNRGICGVRENQSGKLFVLNYGKIIAHRLDPIEKKPLFHFLPGTYSLSIAAVGCNFKCANCQNWDISQGFKGTKEILGEKFTPEEIVKMAIENNAPSISYTYTEPTIFSEFALDTMKLAKKAGLKNIWVSNGFMSKESAEMIIPYLDANNIDIKSFSEDFYKDNCGARLEPVLETAKLMKKYGVWVEITTLVIPGLNDQPDNLKKIAEFIKNDLGTETPWHITKFSSEISWKLKSVLDTPEKTLLAAYKIGKEAELKYVYTGNITGLDSENTFCPKCDNLAISRIGYEIERFDKNGECPKCGEKLDIIN